MLEVAALMAACVLLGMAVGVPLGMGLEQRLQVLRRCGDVWRGHRPDMRRHHTQVPKNTDK